jgi:hypothetical protein
MATRHFPVRPNLEQLKHQDKDLLRAYRRGDAEALEDFREHLIDGDSRILPPQKMRIWGTHDLGTVEESGEHLPVPVNGESIQSLLG